MKIILKSLSLTETPLASNVQFQIPVKTSEI